jgi:hypothetical protein
MLWISNKELKEIMEALIIRMSYMEESLRMLHNEVRRIHVLQTCGGENLQFKEINQRLSNIEDQLSNHIFLIKRTKKESKGTI